MRKMALFMIGAILVGGGCSSTINILNSDARIVRITTNETASIWAKCMGHRQIMDFLAKLS